MEIRVRLEETDVDAVRALREWLADDPTVLRHGRLRWADDSDPEHMGGVFETICVVLGLGLNALELAFVIARWRDSRRRAPAVLLTTERGITVRIESSDPAVLARLARDVEPPATDPPGRLRPADPPPAVPPDEPPADR